MEILTTSTFVRGESETVCVDGYVVCVQSRCAQCR